MAYAMASAVFREVHANSKNPKKVRETLAFLVRRYKQLGRGGQALLIHIIQLDGRNGITGGEPFV